MLRCECPFSSQAFAGAQSTSWRDVIDPSHGRLVWGVSTEASKLHSCCGACMIADLRQLGESPLGRFALSSDCSAAIQTKMQTRLNRHRSTSFLGVVRGRWVDVKVVYVPAVKIKHAREPAESTVRSLCTPRVLIYYRSRPRHHYPSSTVEARIMRASTFSAITFVDHVRMVRPLTSR